MGWGAHDLTGFGRFLRQAREYKGASLRDVERKTRIPRRHLLALENEQYDQLPPLIYARGIVRNYAQYLGLDPVDALSRFQQSHGQRSGGFQVVPAVKTTEVPSHWAPNFAIIAFMVIMSAVIFAWMYSAYFAPPDNSAPTEQAVETPEADQEVAVIDEDDSEADDEENSFAEGGGESLVTSSDDEESLENGEGEPAEPGEENDSSLASGEGAAEPTAEPEPVSEDGTHTFVISTTQPVWVHATVDDEIVLDDVIQPGMAVTFQGEWMWIRSGNAPYVNVNVDGEDYGRLGEVWDAAGTYP
jgi:cytoskeleton protein RodZ